MECLDNVLDYGCGNGWADVFLAKKGARNIHAVDVSENGVKTPKSEIETARKYKADYERRHQHE